jgi:hypothetical protein
MFVKKMNTSYNVLLLFQLYVDVHDKIYVFKKVRTTYNCLMRKEWLTQWLSFFFYAIQDILQPTPIGFFPVQIFIPATARLLGVTN